MTRLSPHVLVELARRTVEGELKWTRTALHVPPVPTGAVSDDLLAEMSPLDMRLLQRLGVRADYKEVTHLRYQGMTRSCYPTALIRCTGRTSDR